tara:strand:+ start:1088 stop:1279 length:192 start_codon:yes stop_codon:yes gene_type:complete
MNLIINSTAKSLFQQITNQTIVGLLNSACGELRQYVILNSGFFKEKLSSLSLKNHSSSLSSAG